MSKKIAGPIAGAAVGAVFGVLLTRTDFRQATAAGFLQVFPSIVLWLLFFAYWGMAARGAAPARDSESARSTITHQTMLCGALLLLVWPELPWLGGRFLPRSPIWVALGLAIQASFFALAVWARRHLGRNWSSEVRIAVGHQLVRTGPYRYLRHPIYTAMLGMFVGTAVVTGLLQSLVAVAILAVAYRRKIRLEEEILSKTFAAEYEEYQRQSWALVPLLF